MWFSSVKQLSIISNDMDFFCCPKFTSTLVYYDSQHYLSCATSVVDK